MYAGAGFFNMRDVGGRWLLALALVALPCPAAAQATGGPFGGLFGRTPPRTGQDVTLLEARTAIGGLYDGALPGDGGAVIPNEPTSASSKL